MKKYALIIIYLMISMSFFALSQENINFTKLDLSEHYKAIDKIIAEPDSIIRTLFEYELISDKSYYDSIKIDHFNYLIPFIKKYCDKEYKIIDDEIFLESETIDKLMDCNMINEYTYHTTHIVKTQNIINKYVQYFYFTLDEDNWKLFNIQTQNPKEYPNIHIDIETKQKKEMKKIDTNNPEQCKLYNDDSYEAIKKLLNNPDSLINLYSKILLSPELEEKTEVVKLFAQNAQSAPQELIVKYDHIFLPLKEFKDKTITILNEIELVSPNIPKKTLKFYFMKKDEVWQFYEGKLDVFSRYP